jgi:hypothetical protein
MSEPLPPPQCIAIILCEEVHRIHNTWNFIIHRTFHTLYTPAFPFQFPRITVFSTLTGGHGSYDMEVAVVHARAQRDLMGARRRFTIQNPLGITDMETVLLNVPIPEAGKYWVELRCDGGLVAQRPFFVKPLSRDQAEGEPPPAP